MADRIKGISVLISGDTTGLSKALSGINKDIKNTQSQLKDVEKLLKLDPSNTELLSQKQKLLKEAIGETKEKLEQLKSVQDQMEAGLANGSITRDQYDAWQREIIATEQELKNLEAQCRNTDSSISATLKNAGSKVSAVGDKMSSAGDSLTKNVTAPIAAIGAASIAAWNEVDCLFQKTYSDFRFQRHTNRGERDQFYMEDHHEPIISREDFEAADQILRQHAKEKNVTGGDKYVKRYPFTKKIICGECGTAFKRRINSTGKIKYPAWVCRKHLEKKEECSMRFVREDAMEHAFAVMMNKLIFGKTTVLENLLVNLQSQSDKESLLRIDAINESLEGMTERRQALTSIMTKGYIDPAVFTQETNNLQAEAAALEAEREKLMGEISGDRKKTEALKELIRFAGKGSMLSGFDSELFGQFVEQVTVCSRKEIEFHLKCGLKIKERIG